MALAFGVLVQRRDHRREQEQGRRCVRRATSGYAVLHSGDTVGPASTFNRTVTPMKNWQPGVDGYIGIAFVNSQTGALNYGYIHIDDDGPYWIPRRSARVRIQQYRRGNHDSVDANFSTCASKGRSDFPVGLFRRRAFFRRRKLRLTTAASRDYLARTFIRTRPSSVDPCSKNCSVVWLNPRKAI